MIIFADSEGPGQTARMRRLTWAFAVRACPEGTFLLGVAQVQSDQDLCYTSLCSTVTKDSISGQ